MKSGAGFVIDSRERLPYLFKGLPTITKKLDAGDYSLVGFEGRVAVERKEHGDAYGCIGASRKRFLRCLERLSKLDRAAIVIESSMASFSIPPSRSTISARQAMGSYVSWACEYRIPVFWCENRAYGERVTLMFLMSYLRHAQAQ
jgi:ERCC4-type nuclease